MDLSYKYHFYDGAAIPIGLGLSLFLNAIFLAGKINKEGVLTLPDVLARRYGKVVEVMVSLTTITSFIMLLAGNLVGLGIIQAYVWNISVSASIWIAAAIVWGYTVCGGLFSVAYTDVVQAIIGWSGVVVAAFWFIANAKEDAPPPSIGFPGYMYPNDEICNLYEGVPCTNDAEACCYNTSKWCDTNGANCYSDVSAYLHLKCRHPSASWFLNRFPCIVPFCIEWLVSNWRCSNSLRSNDESHSSVSLSKWYLLELGNHSNSRFWKSYVFLLHCANLKRYTSGSSVVSFPNFFSGGTRLSISLYGWQIPSSCYSGMYYCGKLHYLHGHSVFLFGSDHSLLLRP